MEAVKAVVMFHTQALYGRAMYCKVRLTVIQWNTLLINELFKMDRKNNEQVKPEKKKLPDGLGGLNINPDILNLPAGTGSNKKFVMRISWYTQFLSQIKYIISDRFLFLSYSDLR